MISTPLTRPLMRSIPARGLWIALAAVLSLPLLAGPLHAQGDAPAPVRSEDPPVADAPGESLVVLNDGRRFRGRVKSRDRFELVLEIAGIDTRFKTTDVLEIIPLKTFEEHYDELKAAIHPEDWDRRVQFCAWIHKRRRLEIAARELEELLDDNPRLEDAREMLRLVNAEIELEVKAQEAERERQSQPSGADPSGEEGGPRLTPTMLLSDEQVNLMRVYEVDLKNPPRLLVRRSTIERLLSEYPTSELLPTTPEGRKAYYRRDPVDVLSDLFALQARDPVLTGDQLIEALGTDADRLAIAGQLRRDLRHRLTRPRQLLQRPS